MNGVTWNDRELFTTVSVAGDERIFPQETNLFVSNLPARLTVQEVFEEVQKVLGKSVLRGVHLGRERGEFYLQLVVMPCLLCCHGALRTGTVRYAHLYFFTPQQAALALDILNGALMQGIRLTVSHSLSKEETARFYSHKQR